ncbi:splicing factor, arginine/serine-rich 19-like isoform X1 [Hordeum vulgare subsp. vulgare]|uniref:Predicted protein n=1 Tax=Hordeum vulgare subsp. vulgare TaxID=112509 RepID=F2DWL7_HORVV|nr:splicing factor, arginine/serine-rich 19-like isoform X1 [Hordeum vulgare subsp. vulgare]BAJ99488.1 predicted protein [Hordeum vulgare subsp. vulgare]BAK05727.1 predicted protein [Hordeum vulgare subsp. vulgare]
MGGGSLAIVEKKPPFGGGGAGGCAGGVLFHLLDWHRRLARKRRLFSPRRLLPSAARSSSLRRLPPPPPSPSAPQLPRPAQSAGAGPDGKAPAAPPGVVARLMGLESWPAAPPRPQKQRKVEATASAGGDNEPAPVVVMLPPSRRPPAPGSPTHATRSHHSADLPARSPRRTRLVHAAASRLLEPGARGSSKASARLQAMAYACSSPQHRGHPGAPQQSWGTLEIDDFLSRSDSLSLERRAPPPPPPPADTDQRGNAVSSRWQEADPVNTMSGTAAAGSVTSTSHTIVVPRVDSYDAHMSRSSSSDVDAMQRDYRARTGGMGSYAGVRSSNAGAGARTGEQRLSRKRGALSRPDVPRSAGSGNLASSTRSIGNARESAPASSRRAAHNSGSSSMRAPHNSGLRRESMSSTTPQRSTLRDVIDRNGSASTSRDTSNASGQRRGSRKKIDHSIAASNRGGRNTIAFSSSSSARPVSRASSNGKVSENRGLRSTQADTGCARMPVVDAKCSEAEPCAMGSTSEKEEFRRLLKAKVNELGLSDRVEPSDGHSANLTVSVLQELISALTNDTNTSASQTSNYSDSSAPLNNAETVYNSNVQSPDFHKRYQFQDDQGADSSATCTNDEPNQPSPTSVLEACFSNDASSVGSPTENIESTEFFVSMENKMEDLFNLESDIVDLSMSIDTTKSDDRGGSAEIPYVQSSPEHDFAFLEGRLHSIGEAIANAELLLDSSLFCGSSSSLSLHSFIVEMLETVEAVFGDGSESSLGFKEENKCQRTNFLFDCIVESLDSKFRDFGKCGYKALLRTPLTLSKDLLKREISEEIGSWSEMSSDRATAEKELEQVVAARWDPCRTEAFDISVAIEGDILEAIVGEFAFDQCCR